MRVTVTIDDELHAAAKQLARERGMTLSATVEAALRLELAMPAEASEDAPAQPEG